MNEIALTWNSAEETKKQLVIYDHGAARKENLQISRFNSKFQQISSLNNSLSLSL